MRAAAQLERVDAVLVASPPGRGPCRRRAPPRRISRRTAPWRRSATAGVRRHQPRRDLGILADAGVHLGLDPGEVVVASSASAGRRRSAAGPARSGCPSAPHGCRAGGAAPRAAGGSRSGGRGCRCGGRGPPPPAPPAPSLRLAMRHGAEVDEQVAELLLRVAHHDAAGLAGRDQPGIADLAAALGVEGRLVQHHRDLGAGRRAARPPRRPPPRRGSRPPRSRWSSRGTRWRRASP